MDALHYYYYQLYYTIYTTIREDFKLCCQFHHPQLDTQNTVLTIIAEKHDKFLACIKIQL